MGSTISAWASHMPHYRISLVCAITLFVFLLPLPCNTQRTVTMVNDWKSRSPGFDRISFWLLAIVAPSAHTLPLSLQLIFLETPPSFFRTIRKIQTDCPVAKTPRNIVSGRVFYACLGFYHTLAGVRLILLSASFSKSAYCWHVFGTQTHGFVKTVSA